MKTFVVARDDDSDLRFSGELIAERSNRGCTGPTQDKWEELALYRTAGGQWVAVRVWRSNWQGSRDYHEALVSKTAAKVQEFFGWGENAKALYELAGFDLTTYVE
jgi:hypothetical protein